MQMSNMFPPGRILWALRDSDLHHSHRKESEVSAKWKDKLRLFEVLDAEKVFSQIVFAKDMLRCVVLPQVVW
jgi:sn1-specific diacylglycerol lipase